MYILFNFVLIFITYFVMYLPAMVNKDFYQL